MAEWLSKFGMLSQSVTSLGLTLRSDTDLIQYELGCKMGYKTQTLTFVLMYIKPNEIHLKTPNAITIKYFMSKLGRV